MSPLLFLCSNFWWFSLLWIAWSEDSSTCTTFLFFTILINYFAHTYFLKIFDCHLVRNLFLQEFFYRQLSAFLTMKMHWVLRLTVFIAGNLAWQRKLTFAVFKLVESLTAMLALSKVFTFRINEKLSGNFVPFVFILGFSKIMQSFTLQCLGENFLIFQTIFFCFAYCWWKAFLFHIRSNASLCKKKLYEFSRSRGYSKNHKVSYKISHRFFIYHTETV